MPYSYPKLYSSNVPILQHGLFQTPIKHSKITQTQSQKNSFGASHVLPVKKPHLIGTKFANLRIQEDLSKNELSWMTKV
ncbi:hypothetical protein LguiB_011713 [Lonicera macranthoides]